MIPRVMKCFGLINKTENIVESKTFPKLLYAYVKMRAL